MLNKYIFTNQNYKPVCIAYYPNDEIALQEAEKLAYEKDQVVYVVRHLTSRALDENDERGLEALQKEIIKYTDDTEKYLVENWIVENGYDTVFVDRYFATIKRIVNDAAKNRHSRQ